MSDVISLGILVADVVAKPIKQWPEEGQLILVDQFELHTGGCAMNTAVALSRLGLSAGIIGKVGQDAFGDYLVAALQREGVDTAGIRRQEGVNTSASMVCVTPSGERSFIHYLGANAELGAEDVDFDIVERAKVLHVGAALLIPKLDGAPLAGVLKRAQELGVTTVLDTAWDGRGRWMEAVGPCLPYTDYCVPSYEEARMLTGERDPAAIARVFLAAGVKYVGIKLGEKGCYVRSAHEEYHLPPYQVEAVDATGAGDSWVAGFITGIVTGRSLVETARLGNAVGAMSVTAMGASNGIRSLAETEEFMRQTPVREG
ncbi:MAG TPA: carbohydrate kinase family protein [Armatimonadota bacterium]|nr:carbohydrate kinase family protein [Armatimonadota bacterium]HOM81733.1 carbohydrate kinase family protein [Armatimonadota bacterium]HPO73171.1 carbohydrate kinase family protein [Armatimonadota bacterium]HPT96764.1 carbohydrate kinase family protein [Armatimonadota bacterium]